MIKRSQTLRVTRSIGILFVSLFCINMATAVEVGEQAPDFTMPSTTGDKVSLTQFKGKKNVLVQFYSMDFNPT